METVIIWTPRVLGALCLLVAASTAVSLLAGRPSWGQFRRLGGTAAAFLWVQVAFWVAIADVGVATAGVVFGFPLWIDLIVAALPIAIVLAVLKKLSSRETFALHLFAPLVLAPLAIPAGRLIGRVMQDGGVTLSKTVGVRLARAGSDLAADVAAPRAIGARPGAVAIGDRGEVATAAAMRGVPRRTTETPFGIVAYESTQAFGRVAESETYKRVLAERHAGLPRWRKLSSKINRVHGIDHFFWRRIDDGQYVFRIVETKANASPLRPDQMSLDGIARRLDALIAGAQDAESKAVLSAARVAVGAGGASVKREVWRYDFPSGIASIRAVSEEGRAVGPVLRQFDFANGIRVAIDSGRLVPAH